MNSQLQQLIGRRERDQSDIAEPIEADVASVFAGSVCQRGGAIGCLKHEVNVLSGAIERLRSVGAVPLLDDVSRQ